MYRAYLLGLLILIHRISCGNAPFQNLLSVGLKNLNRLIEEDEDNHTNKQLTKARKILVILIEEFGDLDWPMIVKNIKKNLSPKRYKAVQNAWNRLCMFSGFHSNDFSEFFTETGDNEYENLQAWRGMEAIISAGELLSEWELLGAVEFLDNLLEILEKDIDKYREEVAELITGVRLGLEKISHYLQK
jgi:hypothetical protein